MPTLNDIGLIIQTDSEDQRVNLMTLNQISQEDGKWDINYHFVTSSGELSTAGYNSQTMEAVMFQTITSPEQGLFEFAYGHSSSPESYMTGGYQYTVLFNDVLGNLNIQPTTDATAAALNVGALSYDSDGDGNGTNGTTDPGKVLYTHVQSSQDNPTDPHYSTDYGSQVYGDTWLNTDFYLKWPTSISGGQFQVEGSSQSYSVAGSLQFNAIIHEIGHELGLAHPVTAQGATTVLDKTQYSIMSDHFLPGMTVGNLQDNSDFVEPSGLQMYDIAALQDIYQSRNYDTRHTDTTYTQGQGFGASVTTPFIYTIWDGGGTDVIDTRLYADHVTIDLRQGEFSSIGKALDSSWAAGTRGEGLVENNVGIAYYTVIENAIGTNDAAHGDILIGNAWNNVLAGEAGNDTIYGDGQTYDGTQEFTGDTDAYASQRATDNQWVHSAADGSGDDILLGGTGDDHLYGGLGNDILHGGYVKAEIDALRPGWDAAGQFTGSGTALTDIAHASDGTDTVDYSKLVNIGINAYLSADGDTVYKGDTSGSQGIDHLISIENVIGTQSADAFTGTHGVGTVVVLDGGAGSDTYNFVIDGNAGGTVVINEDNTLGGLDTVNIATSANDTEIGIGLWNETVNGHDYLKISVSGTEGNDALNIDLDKAAILAGTGVENVVIDGYTFRSADLLAWLPNYVPGSNGAYPAFSAASLYHVITQSQGTDSNGNPNGTGYGGGTTVAVDTNGDVTGQTVDKSITSNGGIANGGGLISYAVGNEIMHPFIIVGAEIARSGDSAHSQVTYQTTTKEIDLLGITQNDVRFFLTGTEGHADLTVSAGDYSFTISNFETGTEIIGIASFNEELHTAVQTSDTSSLVATGIGSFSGDYAGTGVADLITTGAVDVTYFFENLTTMGDGHVFNMQTDTLTFTGSNADDTMTGLDTRADVIESLGGNDYIYSYGGDDTLVGGAGNDHLFGGTGNDTYVFSAGDGSDIITEYAGEGTDTIALHGVSPDDVLMWLDSSGSLHVSYSATDAVVVAGGHIDGTHGGTVGSVEQITFDDSTTWDLTGGLHLTADSSGATVYGTTHGDVIEGLSGSEWLYGYDGDDVLNGHTGTDHLYGGAGNDTYTFSLGDGSDTVSEYAGEGTDTVALHGVTPDDVHMWLDGSGSLHVIYSATDAVTISGGSLDGTHGGTVGSVEQITFDDSTTWDLTGGLHLTADSSGATVYGTTHGDVIEGLSGSEWLYGYDGDDVLNGHAGADHLVGGAGNDTYTFSLGDGSDTITEYAGEGTDTIALHGVNPDDVRMWLDGSGSLHVSYSATDAVTISGGSLDGTHGGTVGSVEQITFDDSTTWDLTGGLHLTADSSGATVYGTTYGDVIEGLSGNEWIYGFDGDDTLIGGGGADNLYGGAGADTFVLTDAAHSSTIGDFSTAEGDVIDISNLLTGYDPVNDNLSDFVQLTTNGSSTTLSVDTDGTGTGHAMAQVATLSGVTGLNLNDLIDTGHLVVHAAA